MREITATGRAATVSPFQEFLGSQGLQVRRSSEVNGAYELARSFNKKAGLPEDTGIYPVSKYQALRYALEDGRMDRAEDAIVKLMATESGLTPDKLAKGFRESLFRPFTGTQARDAEFIKTLKGDDLQTVKTAQASRQKMWNDFENIIHSRPLR
jgi:hypothetical protein